MPPSSRALAAALLVAALAACGTPAGHSRPEPSRTEAAGLPDRPAPPPGLPGMPPVLDARDVYAADHAGRLAPAVKDFPSRVYVPNTNSNTVSVIDPATYKVIETVPVGNQPQHVVPSWDLRTLWVNNDLGDSLTAIDPATGKTGRTLDVSDPYNLYFTPNGRYAVVMASMDRELVFRDPRTMKIARTVPVDCAGVNHADFSADGRYFIVSCEFSGDLLKVDTEKMKVVGQQKLPLRGAMPQDVKLSPDGTTFYIADMAAHGMWVLDGKAFTTPELLPTGKGAHGLYVSRDSREMYVSNRGEGSVSVFDFARRKLTKKWHLPGGGSPDMGGVSADGKVLWLSGRYDAEVYAIDTTSGEELARIPVGSGPHGLAVYPQAGRYSLGHTGVFR
ncbi:beta-propeller fold lactonase family protein [Streptomyces sp. NPDC102402]|uniref:YVTN family beta-propeller repeat protein n=1 Tax=Streptomyces sp. NPDC102402 TaxID=3366169 RepID=UPI00382FC6FE